MSKSGTTEISIFILVCYWTNVTNMSKGGVYQYLKRIVFKKSNWTVPISELPYKTGMHSMYHKYRVLGLRNIILHKKQNKILSKTYKLGLVLVSLLKYNSLKNIQVRIGIGILIKIWQKWTCWLLWQWQWQLLTNPHIPLSTVHLLVEISLHEWSPLTTCTQSRNANREVTSHKLTCTAWLAFTVSGLASC